MTDPIPDFAQRLAREADGKVMPAGTAPVTGDLLIRALRPGEPPLPPGWTLRATSGCYKIATECGPPQPDTYVIRPVEWLPPESRH